MGNGEKKNFQPYTLKNTSHNKRYCTVRKKEVTHKYEYRNDEKNSQFIILTVISAVRDSSTVMMVKCLYSLIGQHN